MAALGQAQDGQVAAHSDGDQYPTLDGQLLALGEKCSAGTPATTPSRVKAITQSTVAGPIPVKKRRRSTPAAPATSVVYTRMPGISLESAISRAPAFRSRPLTRSSRGV